MSELEKVLKKVVYGGIGAAAALVEGVEELGRDLVKKGEEVARGSQETAEDIKRRVKEFCDKFANENTIDVTRLTVAQRNELRAQLKALEAEDEAAAQAAEAVPTDDAVPVYEEEPACCECEEVCECDEPCECEECACEEAADEPAEPTYTAPDGE